MNAGRCDVAIVGGGITGLAMGLALHRQGFAVQVIERAAPPPPPDPAHTDPRVYAISPASAQLLDALGVWPSVLAGPAAAMVRMQVWDREPAAGLHFEASGLGAGALGWIVEHARLAVALRQALPPDRLRAPCEVRAVDFGDSAVRLDLSDGATLQAALAISAEGAQSQLREAAGIEVLGWDYRATAVVCHLRSEQAHRGGALQRFLPPGPVALLPLADGRRSLVWSTAAPDAEALLALDDASFCAHLAEAVQDQAGALCEPTRRLRFDLRLMHAETYVAPRCALIGDSAHQLHPLAGQGLNLGLADVAELAATLRDARDAGRDWSALRSLRRYERARQAANLEMLALTDALGRAWSLDLPGWRRLLSLGMTAVDRLPGAKPMLAARAARS